MQFFENIAIRPDGSSDRTLHDLFTTLKRAELRSNIGIQNHRYQIYSLTKKVKQG